MISESSVVAQRDVFLLPFLVQALAAALVQVALFERYGPAAAQFAGGQAPVLVVLFGRRVEQVRSPSRLPGGRRRGAGRGQVLGHGQAAVERARGRRRLRHVVVVERDGQLQRLSSERRRRQRVGGPEHRRRVFERVADRAANVVGRRRGHAAAAVDGRGRRRGLRGERGPGPGGRRRQRVMMVVVRRGRQTYRSGRRRAGSRATGVRQARGGRRQSLLDDLLTSCEGEIHVSTSCSVEDFSLLLFFCTILLLRSKNAVVGEWIEISGK